jgi:hypothetical protein
MTNYIWEIHELSFKSFDWILLFNRIKKYALSLQLYYIYLWKWMKLMLESSQRDGKNIQKDNFSNKEEFN